MPRELAPGVTKVTVRSSRKLPMGVVNDFVKVEPNVTGVGEVNTVVVPVVSPMLFRRMVVTVVGAPDVIVVAVVTSPVSAVKVPFGTKLKATWIGTAQAGEALTAATAITVLRRAVRRVGILIIISSTRQVSIDH